MFSWPRILYDLYKSQLILKQPRKEIIKYQNKRLQYIVKNAYDNVPFYKNLFNKNNVKPSDIKDLSDLKKIPIIRKKEFKADSMLNLVSSAYDNEKLITLKTGGSTGEPLSTYIAEEEKAYRIAIHLRSNLNCGQKFSHQWARIDNVDSFTQIRQRIKFFPFTAIPLLWNVNNQLKALHTVKPQVIDGLSSAIWILAREVPSSIYAPLHPIVVFGTGELISSSSRIDIESAFNSVYLDQVSCTEVGRTAWECTEKSGYHMNVDSTIIEFIDDAGEPVAAGERGEMVYTSLHNQAMPIIRYGIQDIGIPLDDECACGISLPLMKMIEGRQNSFIMLPDGSVVSPWRFIEALKLFLLTDDIAKYRIIQEKKDHIKIYIEKTHDKVEEQFINEWILNKTKKEFTENGINLSDILIEINYVDAIPSSKRGKLNVISSKLNDIPVF
jgi:phenylacetate-CoA ligase